MTSALTLLSITKRFGPTLALDQASLTLQPGTVHALLGENGAGKTTLMRIAFGMLAPDHGTVCIGAQRCQFASPADAIAAGVGMVHQHFMLVLAMTVAENIALGGHGRFDVTRNRARVRDVSARNQLPIDPDAIVGTLPLGAQQRVEILKALARDATILIFDEPTAVLTPQEARELLRNMRAFVERGGSVVLITHKLRDALEFTDDVTVLRRGRTVLTGRARDMDEHTLARTMIGMESRSETDGSLGQSAFHPIVPTLGRAVFVLRDVVARDERGIQRLKGVNMTVRSGEIVGIAAVEGNGHRELLRILAGRMAASSGTVERPEEVGFIPEDRQRDALILDFPLYENVALRGAGRRRGRVSWGAIRQATAALLDTYDVRATGIDMQVGSLSGGNQQKLVVGREVEGSPEALVVENPTHGLDVQAAAAVQHRLQGARSRGAAIVLYSSDLDEVLDLADRILVVCDGTLREVPHERDAIGRAMLAGSTRHNLVARER